MRRAGTCAIKHAADGDMARGLLWRTDMFATKFALQVAFISGLLAGCGSDPAPRPEVADFCKVTESHAKTCRYKFDTDKCLSPSPRDDAGPGLALRLRQR